MIRRLFSRLFSNLKPSSCLMIALGNVILAFGLYNVHAQTHVTEGGVLGMMLLLKHWFNISPAYSGIVINALCFYFGWKVLGGGFLGYSAVANIIFAIAYRLLETTDPLWPQLYAHPFVAAILGALFVGIGAGICVRCGGASGGDDALAMALAKMTHLEIQWLYLITDMVVLLLSLTYISLSRMVWSFVTVVLSGQIIGWIQKIPVRAKK